uniref:TPT domain-containing protein n=1 Tax=Syphacia muris TaxID=451379 RepID=A0A0N5AKI2_9BILA
MPKVDRTAERPTNSKLDQNSVKLLLQNDATNGSISGSTLERFLLFTFLVTVFILISVYFKISNVKQPMLPEDDVVQIRTVYSGTVFSLLYPSIIL